MDMCSCLIYQTVYNLRIGNGTLHVYGVPFSIVSTTIINWINIECTPNLTYANVSVVKLFLLFPYCFMFVLQALNFRWKVYASGLRGEKIPLLMIFMASRDRYSWHSLGNKATLDVMYPASRMHVSQYHGSSAALGWLGCTRQINYTAFMPICMVSSPLHQLLCRMLPTMFAITLTIIYRIQKNACVDTWVCLLCSFWLVILEERLLLSKASLETCSLRSRTSWSVKSSSRIAFWSMGWRRRRKGGGGGEEEEKEEEEKEEEEKRRKRERRSEGKRGRRRERWRGAWAAEGG